MVNKKRIAILVACTIFFQMGYHIMPLSVYAAYNVNGLTSAEMDLYSSHPIKAAKAKKAADAATKKTNTLYKPYCTYQGNGDAFRHAYWSALMTKKIDRAFAYDAGLAHEGLTEDYDFDKQSEDHKMDISNNYSGRKLGTKYSDLSDAKLADKVKDYCSNGNLKRIRTYTSQSPKKNKKVEVFDGINTLYVGYYVETTDGGLY